MKNLFVIAILFAALGISYLAYSKGIEYLDCGCGCVGNDLGKFPNTTAFYLVEEYRRPQPQPLEYCAIVGYSTPRVPLYLDLYGISGILMLWVLAMVTQQKSELL